ncbi:MAG TPA: pitrilysin family protein [Candidatus Kapabacteria bacterium]|nr:pitrilysin family protein [Candidatus Kapabacteria bacterium]
MLRIFVFFGLIILKVMTMTASVNAATDFNPIQFTVDTLDNGLTVIYHIDKSAPIVSTIVHYKVGSKDENPNLTGFAHFFEHLMFESTDKIKRGEMDKLIQLAGGNLNAHTSFDETVYKINLPSNQLPLALWIEGQRMRKLSVDTIGVETQRGVIQEERKQRMENQPYGTAFDKVCEKLFAGGSYSWTPIGSEKHINEASIDEFRTFYNNFYQPNNATLVIAGDFDIKVAAKYVEAYFGGYPKSNNIKREKFLLTPMKSEYKETIYDEKAQLPAVFVAYPSVDLSDTNYFALKLMGDILASGESSRLYRRLVDKEQSAVAAEFENLNLQNSGLTLLIGIATPGTEISTIEKQIDEEIENLIKNGVSDDELQKAKNITEAQFVNSKKNVAEKAQELARLYSYYGDASVINTELANFNKVTKEDITRVAKMYFATKNRVVLTYLPKPNN